MVDALQAARPGIIGKTGPGNAFQPHLPQAQIPGNGIAAFKSRPPAPFAQNIGPNPNILGDRAMKFIPPLALFNDASQWVNTLFFNRPLPFNGNPDCNPPLRAQYMKTRPNAVTSLAAGALNLQLQLGNIDNQAQMLTEAASNYFGG